MKTEAAQHQNEDRNAEIVYHKHKQFLIRIKAGSHVSPDRKAAEQIILLTKGARIMTTHSTSLHERAWKVPLIECSRLVCT
ncbi:hypothetical protein PsorP6_006874 [Peronosclerospora sorghi]|uniref:Uncharacterized protein n=1 Tax=Peronosclerospora sorghi TaxID=230839 RepID=A0ACC0WB02_9STRA|nr:hypothetical protein PsorP6_006874 [Peronosclerospora sorghi]